MLSRNLRLILGILLLTLNACQDGQETKVATEQSRFHKLLVQEVLQAREYTYLRAKENDKEIWVAVPTMQAKTGDTYYYEGGIEMKKFESKDLNKVFESVLLLERLNREPNSSSAIAADKPYKSTEEPATAPEAAPATADGAAEGGAATGEGYKRKATPPEKLNIKIEAAKGGISIAKLFAEKESLSGKTVKIKGRVTKYTPAVMKKNWIHIQDGTDNKGNFDLVVTTDKEVQVGDIVTLEGKIGLNKDLGYGYFFDVIMEDAQVIQ